MAVAHDGGCAVVRLAGESAEQLSEKPDRLLREGQRSVLLDMGDVTYLSSPGTRVLNRMRREFASRRGELRVGSPSPRLLDALSRGELRRKLVGSAADAETVHRMHFRRGRCWAALVTRVVAAA